MARPVTVVLGLYLVAGMLFAVEDQPPRMWACPAPRAPHGEVLHDRQVSPDCEPTVTAGDLAIRFAAATLIGIPATVVQAVGEAG